MTITMVSIECAIHLVKIAHAVISGILGSSVRQTTLSTWECVWDQLVVSVLQNLKSVSYSETLKLFVNSKNKVNDLNF